MSDEAAVDVPESTPTPTSTPIPGTEPVAAEPPAGDERPEWIANPDQAWDAVQKARDEAAKYRVRARDFDGAFGAYSANEQAYLLDIVRGLASEDDSVRSTAASQMAEVARLMGAPTSAPEPDAPTAPAPAESEGGETDRFTADDIDARIKQALQERDHQQEQQLKEQRVQEFAQRIKSKSEEMGWEPNSFEYNTWTSVAARTGDLDGAAEAVQKWLQDIRDSAVGEKAGAAERFPTQSGRTAGVPPQASDAAWVGSFAETSAEVRKFLAAAAGDSV